jgi:hypothetical protein
MSGQTLDPMGDERFEGELRRFLDWEATVIPGAPTRGEVIERLASRVGRGVGAGRRLQPSLWNPQALRVVIVLALLAALIATAIFVGVSRNERHLVAVAPVTVPPPAGACRGGTALAAIRDASGRGEDIPRWRSAPPPAGPEAVLQGEIGVIVAGRQTGGPPAVELVDPARGTSCVLAELPANMDGAMLWWSPAGDALAVLTGGSVVVWSSIGTTRVIATNDWVDWAPDGSALAVSDSDVSILPADGSPSQPLQCEISPGQTPHFFGDAPTVPVFCPPVPHIHWSPDGTRIAVDGGDRFGPGLFSVASVSDRKMHRLQHGLPGELAIISWLDADTLLVTDDAGQVFAMPVAAPGTARRVGEFQAPGGRLSAFAPDLRSIAWSTSEIGGDLFLTDLATGAQSTIVPIDSLGPDRALYDIEWAPDGRSIAFTVTDNTAIGDQGLTVSPGLAGLWVVDVDGSNLRQVSTIGPELGGANRSIAWRPAWR